MLSHADELEEDKDNAPWVLPDIQDGKAASVSSDEDTNVARHLVVHEEEDKDTFPGMMAGLAARVLLMEDGPLPALVVMALLVMAPQARATTAAAWVLPYCEAPLLALRPAMAPLTRSVAVTASVQLEGAAPLASAAMDLPARPAPVTVWVPAPVTVWVLIEGPGMLVLLMTTGFAPTAAAAPETPCPAAFGCLH